MTTLQVGPLRDLLAALNGPAGVTTAQLSERLGVPHGVLLDRLEGAALAGYVRVADNGVIMRWTITTAGRNLLS